MKKPLIEDNVSFVDMTRVDQRYTLAGVLYYTSAPSSRACGGITHSVRRTGGKKEPLREKAFKRTLLNTVALNGDLSWTERSASSPSYDYIARTRECFSDALSTTYSPRHALGALYPGWTDPLNNYLATTFMDRYNVAVPAINIDLRSQAEVKCLNKLRGKVDVSDLSFGVLWGERRETCELVESLFGATVELMRAVAFKDYKKSAAVLKDAFGSASSVSREKRRIERLERRLKRELKRTPKLAERAVASTENAILAYNLGISPLIKDVKAAVAALAQQDPTEGLDVSAKATYERVINDEATWWKDGKSSDRTCKVHVTVAETHGYTVTLTATPKFDNWTLASRLGIADYSLAWELTSLSFLVDYYLAIGPWLQALNALHEFIWVDGSYTQRVIRNIKMTATSSLLGPGRASGAGLVNHTQRFVYGKMPYPMPPMSKRIRNLSSVDAQDAQANRALNQAALSSRVIRDAINGILR